MGLPQLKVDESFSYADYLSWEDGLRWELIDGEAYCMSPGPGRIHQKWLGELHRQVANYLDDKPCEVFIAPFDVRLPDTADATDDDTMTVVQPDLMVVCDPEKLDDRGIKGAPDLIVEIISPSSSKRDIAVKFDLYQRHGVKEYWILYPKERILQLYRLGDEGRYGTPEVFGENDSVPVPLLGELVVDMGKVFRE